MSQLFKGPPGGGTIGNVTGPASSTDNAIVRWNGITGTLIQDSGVIVNDSDRVTIPVGSSAGLCFGDGDSCLYESSDDVLVLSTAGTPAVTIDATQNVTLANALAVGSGGTGLSSITDGGIVLGSGSSALTVTAQPTNGQLLIGSTGVDPVLANITGGTGITVTNGAGAITIDADNNGDVVGPGSSTDNAVARYDSTTGKLLQDSGVTIDDDGNLDANQTWAGNTRRIGLVNNSNTANSATKLSMVVGGTSAADMYTEMRVGSSRAWSTGIDNDDTQSFKITTDAAATVTPSGGTTVFKIDTSGNPTFPANPLNVASGGTGVTSNTAYAVLCGGTTAAGDIQSIAGVGTSGQVLTSNGAAALPTFQDAGGGGAWEFVSTQTISADATIDFTGLASGYDYKYVLQNVVCATNLQDLYMRIGTGGTPTYATGASDYYGSINGSDDHMELTTTPMGTGTAEQYSGEIIVLNPADTATYCQMIFMSAYLDENPTMKAEFASGMYRATTAVTAVRFYMQSGNLASGTIREYRRTLS